MSKSKNKKLNSVELSSDALDQVAGGQSLENHSSEALDIDTWRDLPQTKDGATDWNQCVDKAQKK